jgi:hypothetical protein
LPVGSSENPLKGKRVEILRVRTEQRYAHCNRRKPIDARQSRNEAKNDSGERHRQRFHRRGLKRLTVILPTRRSLERWRAKIEGVVIPASFPLFRTPIDENALLSKINALWDSGHGFKRV